MVDKKKKERCLVITHPSFNQDGVDGIKEAQQFGQLLLQVIRGSELLEQVPEAQKEALREHLQSFRVLIRKLDPDVLAK